MATNNMAASCGHAEPRTYSRNPPARVRGAAELAGAVRHVLVCMSRDAAGNVPAYVVAAADRLRAVRQEMTVARSGGAGAAGLLEAELLFYVLAAGALDDSEPLEAELARRLRGGPHVGGCVRRLLELYDSGAGGGGMEDACRACSVLLGAAPPRRDGREGRLEAAAARMIELDARDDHVGFFRARAGITPAAAAGACLARPAAVGEAAVLAASKALAGAVRGRALAAALVAYQPGRPLPVGLIERCFGVADGGAYVDAATGGLVASGDGCIVPASLADRRNAASVAVVRASIAADALGARDGAAVPLAERLAEAASATIK